jgi:ADP-ribose pyrophosphatase
MVKPWQCTRSQPGPSFRVFSIRTDTARSPRTGLDHDFFVIETGDWVNVIPLTEDHRVVMIEQYRHGSRQVTLEIPGGMVDPGETAESAASRELLEETGFEAGKIEQLGVVNPSPAIFNNRCYTFIAENVRKVRTPSPDQTEDIEVLLIPVADIPDMIREGKIDHAMVIAAFYWFFHRSLKGAPSISDRP